MREQNNTTVQVCNPSTCFPEISKAFTRQIWPLPSLLVKPNVFYLLLDDQRAKKTSMTGPISPWMKHSSLTTGSIVGAGEVWG